MALPRALAPPVAAALLAVLVAAAFAPALGNGFTGLDDDVRLVENRHLRGDAGEPLRWAFSAEAGRLYVQPLTWLAFAAEAAAFGLDPAAFHAVSVALHALAAALLLLLLWRLTAAPWRSAAAAALFALHPLAVEPVAWAAEQNTLLAAVLALLAAHAHVSHARAPSAGRWLLVAAAFAASLLAKPWLLGLPLVLLVLDVTLGRLPPAGGPGRAAAARRLLLEKVPLLALGVAWALYARLAMQGDPGLQLAPEPQRPLALRLAFAPVALARTLAELVAPVNLSVHHPYPLAVPAWQVLGALAFAAGVTALALAWRRRAPSLLAGWACALLLLAPTLGLVQAGRWPAVAGRFAYLAVGAASAGLAFAVPAALLADRARRWMAGAVVAALAGLLTAGTRAQLEPWRDRIALLTHASEVAPGSALVEYDLGSDLARAGRLAAAERHLRTALELQETSLSRTQLGNVLLAEGRGPEALAEYRRALELAPRNAEALLRLARACEAQGRFGEARRAYQRFLEVAPPSLEPLRRQVAALLGR